MQSKNEQEPLMQVDGACHCESIRYEAKVDLSTVVICHCTDCQIHSGTPFRTAVRVQHADFRLLAGTPKLYVKIGTSGARRALAFCPDCGSALYSCSADGPSAYSLRLGTVRQHHLLTPLSQIWTRSAVPWLNDMHQIPSYPTQGPAPLQPASASKEN